LSIEEDGSATTNSLIPSIRIRSIKNSFSKLPKFVDKLLKGDPGANFYIE
jgi:hypothetical protein